MYNILKLAFVSILSVGLLAGCKSTPTPMQKAFFVTTVSTGVALGADRYPTAVPYLRIAEPIICAAGNSTNVTPAEIIAALTNSPAANAVATPEGKLILNGALVLYITLFDAYGTDYVNHNAQLKQYLQWTCESIGIGLPPAPGPAGLMRASRKALPPHVR